MDKIAYPMDFPVEKFNEKIEELITKNSKEVEEKELIHFLDNLLLNDNSLPLEEYTKKLFYWRNPNLIERIMLVNHQRMRDNSSEKIVYRKIYK